MQLVAVPTVLVALCVALATTITVSRQFLQEFHQGLALLLLKLPRLNLANFALLVTAAFLFPGWGRLGHPHLLCRFLARFYRRAIPTDMAYQPISQRLPHQRRV